MEARDLCFLIVFLGTLGIGLLLICSHRGVTADVPLKTLDQGCQTNCYCCGNASFTVATKWMYLSSFCSIWVLRSMIEGV